MLTGKELGRAISAALAIKGYGAKAALARHLRIKPPSVADMTEFGRIDKAKLTALWGFFSDVVGPSHWGMDQYPWADKGLTLEKKRLSEPPNTELGPEIRGRVPLISWVQAGAWCETVDMFEPGDAEEWLPCPVKHGDRTFVLIVRGPSMFNPHGNHSFKDGDMIFVDPDRQAENGSLVVVRLDDAKEATFKKLVIEGESRHLQALNPAWPEQIIRIDGNATICGVAISKMEKL